MAFAGYFYTMRLYASKTSEKWLKFEDAQEILTGPNVPERLTHMCEHTSIPKDEELEHASEKLFGTTTDE